MRRSCTWRLEGEGRGASRNVAASDPLPHQTRNQCETFARFAAGGTERKAPRGRSIASRRSVLRTEANTCTALHASHVVYSRRAHRAVHTAPSQPSIVPSTCARPHVFVFFSSEGTPVRFGGMGISPAWPRMRATGWLGCAPTDSQYLMRSKLSPTCLLPSLPGMGS